MNDARDDRRASLGGSPLPEPLSFRPDGDLGAGADPDDMDSDPRPKWKPNPALLQALADARKDLKPGEASLFWDWTSTRNSAPPAEDVRPSGEGEVIVSDKEAAATYVPPVQVAPALPPRTGTKSRVRVREDVDPRRQPTMKTARSSPSPAPVGLLTGARGMPVAQFRDAVDSRPPASGPARPSPPPRAPSSPSDPGRQAIVPPVPHMRYPISGPERRRRVTWAVLFGTVTGVIVFFWLRIPPASAPPPAAPTGSVAPRPVVTATARPQRQPSLTDGLGTAVPGDHSPPPPRLSPSGVAPSGTAKSQAGLAPAQPAISAPALPPPAVRTPAPPPSSPLHDAPPKSTAVPDKTGDFLVRKKD